MTANPQRKGGKGSRCLTRSAHHARTGKYRRQFERTSRNKIKRLKKQLATASPEQARIISDQIQYWTTAKYSK